MSLKITGKDFKKIHDIINKIKLETNETRAFSDYMSDLKDNGVVIDPFTSKHTFFDDLVYNTNLDYCLGNIDPNNVASGWKEAPIYTKYMKQIHSILNATKKNQKNLKLNEKTRISFIIEWYKKIIEDISEYKTPIKMPYGEQEYYRNLVYKYCKELPQFEISLERLSKDFVDNYVFNPKDSDLMIQALAIQTKNKLEDYMYHPKPKDMIDILIISLCYTSMTQLSYSIGEVAKNFIRNCNKNEAISDKIADALYDVEMEQRYNIWKIWFLIKNQAPKDEAVLRILDWVKKYSNEKEKCKEIDIFYPRYAWNMVDGAKRLINTIILQQKNFSKKWLKELEPDEDNKELIGWLKKEAN